MSIEQEARKDREEKDDNDGEEEARERARASAEMGEGVSGEEEEEEEEEEEAVMEGWKVAMDVGRERGSVALCNLPPDLPEGIYCRSSSSYFRRMQRRREMSHVPERTRHSTSSFIEALPPRSTTLPHRIEQITLVCRSSHPQGCSDIPRKHDSSPPHSTSLYEALRPRPRRTRSAVSS